MNIILWIVFGGIAGWVASMIVGNDAGLGVIGNVIVGIVGAFIGGWVTDKVGVQPGAQGADRPTSVWGFVWAVVGAVLLLLVLNFLF